MDGCIYIYIYIYIYTSIHVCMCVFKQVGVPVYMCMYLSRVFSRLQVYAMNIKPNLADRCVQTNPFTNISSLST